MYVCMYYILYKCIYYIIHTIQFDEQLYCCTAVDDALWWAVVVLSLTKFDEVWPRISNFWGSFDWNLEKSRKFPRESLKLGFLALPSVKHFKKYEKGGFLTTFINMYFMGVWQFKIGKTIKCDVLKRVTNLP